MTLLLTDDELVTIGRIKDGWNWPLMTVPVESRDEADQRGIRSLLVRGLATEDGPHPDLEVIAGYGSATRTIATLYITTDGELAVPDIQLFILTNDSEMWLSDLRMPMGIHRMEQVTSVVLAELLEETCASFINEAMGSIASGFVVLDSQGESSHGFKITDTVQAVRREGEELVTEKTLFSSSEPTRLRTLINALIAN
ncbi:hypothetical protein [uncultured Actinomyces sp.]|uniref:hypothetical protein n=1 Tax=uncultured Actinomyces sp. TaxID=249061 RepID=UPI0028EECE4E|nr:hypothetical protein [uncultured Actinomyces sp.]